MKKSKDLKTVQKIPREALALTGEETLYFIGKNQVQKKEYDEYVKSITKS